MTPSSALAASGEMTENGLCAMSFRSHLPRPLALLVLLGLASCSTQPVRLAELREADAGSIEAGAYLNLEQGIALANEFLARSRFSRGFPAEQASFSLGLNDILLHLKGEGVEVLRIETAGWGDPRTAIGDGVHPTEEGFLSARTTGPTATGSDSADATFLRLPPEKMAAILLRQAATMREIKARGELDYWLNYDLLGLNPSSGWMGNNVVDRRANAVDAAFQQWLAEGRPDDLHTLEG